MDKLLDNIVICVTIVLSLILALFFAYSLVERQADYPPTLISIFLGLCVAALTYRFLGGTDGTTFQVGVLKLGGSAALLIGTTWFLSERIKAEMHILDTSTGYRTQIKQLTETVSARGVEVAERDQMIQQLQSKIEQMPSRAASADIERIKSMTPNDQLVKAIRRMVDAQEKPFSQTIRELTVRVAMVAMPNDGSLYNICPDTFAQLYKDADPNTYILVSRSVGADGEEVNEKLDRRGRIGNDICSSTGRDFDLQIGCASARKLFPEVVATCLDGSQIRGKTVTIGALP